MVDGYEPDKERVQERSVERDHERTEPIADQLSRVGGLFDEENYLVTAAELAVEYGDEVLDLPNERESLGSVFDRLVDVRFESPRGSAGGQLQGTDRRRRGTRGVQRGAPARGTRRGARRRSRRVTGALALTSNSHSRVGHDANVWEHN